MKKVVGAQVGGSCVITGQEAGGRKKGLEAGRRYKLVFSYVTRHLAPMLLPSL